jgi:hypothetical protein
MRLTDPDKVQINNFKISFFPGILALFQGLIGPKSELTYVRVRARL